MDRLTAQSQAFSTIAKAVYSDRCTIKRKVSAKSGLDTTYTHEIVATDVPVRLRPSTAQERQVAGATQGSTAFTARIPSWQGGNVIEIDSKCFLEIAARGKVEAQILQVVAPLPSSGAGIDAVVIRQA